MNVPARPAQATVLVVDDDPAVREVITLLLADDYEVVEAESGPQALEIVRACRVDLVVLDVKLPGLDGLAVLERFRRESPSVNVIMLSAVDAARMAVTAIKLGAVDYLTKPVLEDELREAVTRALSPPVVAVAPRRTIAVLSDDLGWRASLAALIGELHGFNVATASFRHASDIPGEALVVADLIGVHGAHANLLDCVVRSVRGAAWLVWAAEEDASANLGGDWVVVRGRRRIGELLHYVHRETAANAARPVVVSAVTWKAMFAVATSYATTTVEDIARLVALSTRQLGRVFRDDTGLTLKSYVLRVRVEAAKALLRESDASVEAIADSVGLYDASHMGRLFRQFGGVRPGVYRLSRRMSQTS